MMIDVRSLRSSTDNGRSGGMTPRHDFLDLMVEDKEKVGRWDSVRF